MKTMLKTHPQSLSSVASVASAAMRCNEPLSLSGSSLPCWLLLWLFAVAPVVAEAETLRVSKPQPFPGQYLKPTGVVSDGIFHSRALASYFDAGSLSHWSTLKTSRQGGSASRSCLNLIRCSSMFPDVPRCSWKAWNDATKEPTQVFIRRPQSHRVSSLNVCSTAN